jgi:hypothetical protein
MVNPSCYLLWQEVPFIMDHVFNGIMRYQGAVEVISTNVSIALPSAGPAVLALRGTDGPGTVEVKMPDPARSRGGQLVLKCARSSTKSFQCEGGPLIRPGDTLLLACDGQAWYDFMELRVAQSAVIGRVKPGEELELSHEVKDAVADGRAVFVTAESSERVQWTEALAIAGRKPGSFILRARVKNTSEMEAVLTAHYRIG